MSILSQDTSDTHAVAQASEINARIDRLPNWSIPITAKLIFISAYFLAFYDIISIGVALPAITEAFDLSTAHQALPLTTSLFGYVVGAIVFGQLADR
jgi:putative MFS transporter